MITDIVNRMRALLRRGTFEQNLDDELRFHLEQQIEKHTRAGYSPAEARRLARLDFGGTDQVKEECRDSWGVRTFAAFLQDAGYALRSLPRSPSFSIVAVLTLAIGIGANTAIFSLLNRLLLHPAGMDDASRIVAVRTRYGKLSLEFPAASPVAIRELQADRDVFEKAALVDGNFGDLNYTGGSEPERLQGAAVTVEWFGVFGASPALGRIFTPEEDQPNNNRVAVLSHRAWTRLFGANPGVLGRTIELNELSYKIVGVMKPDFQWPKETDVWVPAGLAQSMYAPPNRFNESALAVARLKQGVSEAQANAWMALLTNRVRNSGTRGAQIANEGDWSLSLVPFVDYAVGDNKSAVLILAAAVGLVLLIACANLAGLIVARTLSRTRELAVRAALGASRARILSQILAESLLLSVVGGLAGCGLAVALLSVLLKLAPASAATGLEGGLDFRSLLFCGAVTLTSAALFSLAPCWRILRLNPRAGLSIERHSQTASLGKQRLRSLLVVGETALALLLLASTGLLLRSFARLQAVDPGFDPTGVMTGAYWLPGAKYRSPESQANFHRAVVENLRASPGVKAAGLALAPPFSGFNRGNSFQIVGRPQPPGDPSPQGARSEITPGYMEALSIPLRHGRYFNDQDREGSELVAVIDEILEKRYWPGDNAVGQRIQLGPRQFTIVGVVGKVAKDDLATDSGQGVFYLNTYQVPLPLSFAVVKTTGDATSMAAVIREAVKTADPRQAVHTLRTMDDYVARSLAPRLFALRVLAFFGATALFLAGLGIYGVVSYTTAQRTREIGIRIALGAAQRRVLGLVLAQGVRLVCLGVLLGVTAAVPALRLLEGQLYATNSLDPLSILGGAGTLLLVALVASYLPARRAARVDPASTLRCD